MRKKTGSVSLIFKTFVFTRNVNTRSSNFRKFWPDFNPLSANVALCTANQLTGFYMKATLALNGF